MPQGSNERSPRPAKRRRRRRRHMNPIVYILLVLAVSAILAGVAWNWAGDVLALNKEYHTAVITLPADIFTPQEVTSEDKDANGTTLVTKTINVADLDYITDQLADNGLIQYKELFKLFCSFTGAVKKGKFQPGTYELTTDMDYHALINAMSSGSGSRMTTTVTIPEGYTLDQIFSLLEDKGVSTVEILRKVAANYDYKFSFLQGVLPLGDYHRLEGYLFPDTYEFYMGGGENAAVWVLNKMLLRFDQLFTDEMREKAAQMGYSIHDIVIIASLIEKETDGTDQTKIASVIFNRLERPNDETVGLLGIEAALVYAAGRPITQADFDMDSPYNTFTQKGLPPGPIANPGMVSFYSALTPDDTNYYFYFKGNDGLHHFFRTNKQWTDFIAQQQAERKS